MLVLIFGKQHMDIGKEYLVEETGHIHSTDNKENATTSGMPKIKVIQ